MELKTIVAFVRNEALGRVEARLIDLRVRGLSVSPVKGYGEYANFFNPDWTVSHTRLELFTEDSRVDEIVDAIMESSHTGMAGDGIVAVIPVERLYRIKTKSSITTAEW